MRVPATVETLTRSLRRIVFAFVCCALPLTSPAQVHAQSIPLRVAVSPAITFDSQRQRLKVSVDDQPFAGVIEEVGKQSGAHILVYGSGYDDLTMDFGYVPLGEALKRLLQATSYVMYESENALQVWVLSPHGPGTRVGEFADEHTDAPGLENQLSAGLRSGAANEAMFFADMVGVAFEDLPELQQIRDQLQQRQRDTQPLDVERMDNLEKIQALTSNGLPAPLLEALLRGRTHIPPTPPASATSQLVQ